MRQNLHFVCVSTSDFMAMESKMKHMEINGMESWFVVANM